jgi:hypothetical protein
MPDGEEYDGLSDLELREWVDNHRVRDIREMQSVQLRCLRTLKR